MLSKITRFIPALVLALGLPAQANLVTASVYDGWYNGRRTASGAIYQHYGRSAAFNYLPLGTRLLVTYKGRSVEVVVNDRTAPGLGRLDLSCGAAQTLFGSCYDLQTVRYQVLSR